MLKTYIIYNPKSGSKNQLGELKQAAAKFQIEAEYIEIGQIGRLDRLDHDQVDVVVAAGGDGTVNAVASKIAGTKIKLGVVPVGTLNHFAKDLGIFTELDAAFEAIARGKTARVDTARVNSNIFINNSSIGVYPLAIRARDQIASTVGKWPATLWGGFKALKKLRLFRLNLEIDGKPSSCRIPFAFVGNNSYNASQLGFTNRTSLDQGKLCLYLVKATTNWEVIKLTSKMALGMVGAEKAFEQHLCKIAVLDGKMNSIDVALDGEVKKLELPLKYELQPKNLTVIIP